MKFTVVLDRTVGRWLYRRHVWLYRLTNGRVGHHGPLGPMLILSTRGARSGLRRDVALLYYRRGKDYFVVASNGGRPSHPGWLANIRATPDVSIRVGSRCLDGHAHILDTRERDDVWPTLTAFYAGWSHYQSLTDRALEVVLISIDA